MRVQFSGFLALSAQANLANLAEFCERTSNVWNTQNLRVHLAKKLSINPNKIVVKNANDTIDVGTCDCDAKGQCFADSKTPIEFIINGTSFTDEDYFIINSCFRVSELYKPNDC